MKKNLAEAKSTADSSPLFSANGMSAHSIMKAKLNGKFNLDLTKVGGKVLAMKSNEISSQSSGEKLINQYIITNGGN